MIKILSFTLFSGTAEVRLNNPHPGTPGSQYSGLLEVYHNNQWGTVCNNSWTFKNSLVVCKLLGFPSVEHFYTSGTSYPGNGNNRCIYKYQSCKCTLCSYKQHLKTAIHKYTCTVYLPYFIKQSSTKKQSNIAK